MLIEQAHASGDVTSMFRIVFRSDDSWRGEFFTFIATQ